MKKSMLLVGVLLSAMVYASSDTIVPIEVGGASACAGRDGGQAGRE